MATRGAALARRLLAAAATAPAPRQDALVIYKARSTRRFYSSNGGNGATAPGARPTPPGANGGRGATPPGANGGIGATPPGAAGANGGRGATPPGANGGISATPPGAAGANGPTTPGANFNGWDGTIPPSATSDTRAVLARLLLLPTEKITMSDVTQGWVSTKALRRSFCIAASALLGSVVGTGTVIYSSLAKLNSKQLTEALEKMEKLAAEKRELNEKNEKLRREEWENRIHIILMELATKLFKLEEKELKHRKTLTEAEQLLKKFGFTEGTEVYFGIGRKFKELQLKMDFLREELSKGPEDSPVAAELRDIFTSMESQVNDLKKSIVEAGLATEADIEKGLSPKKDIKK